MAKRKNPAAVALAKRRAEVMTPEERSDSARAGGLVGGKARARKLTAAERKESAKKAAEARMEEEGEMTLTDEDKHWNLAGRPDSCAGTRGG
jgi:hypothetical protein